MTTLLTDPVVEPSTAPSQRLRTTMAAVRVSLSWLGTRKTLTADQKARAADAFGAEGAFLSAGKRPLRLTGSGWPPLSPACVSGPNPGFSGLAVVFFTWPSPLGGGRFRFLSPVLGHKP